MENGFQIPCKVNQYILDANYSTEMVIEFRKQITNLPTLI